MSLRSALLLTCFFCGQFLFAGNIDSLLQELNSAKDTARVFKFLELSMHYRPINIDSSEYYLQSANDYLSEIRGKFSSNDIEKYEAFYYQQKGLLNHRIDEYDSALVYYKKAYEIYVRHDLLVKQVQFLINIGVLHEDQGRFSKALEYYFNSARLADSASLTLEQSRIYINIGVVYLNQQKFKKALLYFKKAIPLKKKVNDKQGEALAYNNIGIVYYYLDEYDKVLRNFKKSLNIYRQINDIRSQAQPFFNIAEIHYEQGELKKALYYYKKSYEIEKQLNKRADQAVSLIAIGNVYKDLKKIDDAIRVQQEAIDILRSIGANHELATALLELSYSYEARGDYKKALEKYKAHKRFEDSVFNMRKEAQIAKIQEQYESEQKDQEIALLKKQNKLAVLENKQQQEQISNRQRIAILGLLVGAFGLFALIMLYRLYRQKKLSNQMLELKNEAIQRKNAEITDVVQKLESSSRGRKAFYRNILTEFSNPLSKISALARLISGSSTTEDIQTSIKHIKGNVFELNKVFEDLFRATEIETGDNQLQKEGIKISELAEHLLRKFTPIANQKNITLNYNIDESCPEIVELDPYKYFQILSNLTVDAIKRAFPGGNVNVDFYYEKPDLLRVRVKDNGDPISDSYKEELYAFFQEKEDLVYTTDRLGLSLGVVKNLVDTFGGSIFIDSNSKQETEFTVAIPAGIMSISTFSFKANGLSLKNANYRHGKVLIAGQPENFARELELNLAKYKMNFVLQQAKDENEALQFLSESAYDICIIDLPEKTGEVEDLVKTFYAAKGDQNIRFIGLSAHISKGYLQECHKVGVTTVVEKPVEIFNLIVEIERSFNALDIKANPLLGFYLDGADEKDPEKKQKIDQAQAQNIDKNIMLINAGLRQKEWKTVMEQIHRIRADKHLLLNREMVQQLNVIEKECVTTRNVDVMSNALILFQKKWNKIKAI
ncbi:Aerobic respiration control sensor protein ArcB [Salinivirga cyanobacteriivorans]|uniref:Aerobic respiration control sensor protein ArcB n=2 Tax=Salinivirga cyanobacteriivorans TaxID=1307839 RepID=A0A0S2I1F3_9BACT|nr:Aerobic respiration control sensor protein ArcB [Salinivirga cyanobacteriivorans]